MKVISGLSIVIPAYNEERCLGEAIKSILREIPASIADFEIILVDDGSTDGTGGVIESLSRSSELIRAVRHPRNLGKGAALISGFRLARKEWILLLDADGQIAFSELSPFLPFAGSCDMIVGQRTNRPESRFRRTFSRGYKWLTALTLRLRVKDVNCPFKLFRRALLEKFELHSMGFLIDAELLYKTASHAFRIKEIPVMSHPRKKGDSKVRPRHALETIRELFALILR